MSLELQFWISLKAGWNTAKLNKHTTNNSDSPPWPLAMKLTQPPSSINTFENVLILINSAWLKATGKIWPRLIFPTLAVRGHTVPDNSQLLTTVENGYFLPRNYFFLYSRLRNEMPNHFHLTSYRFTRHGQSNCPRRRLGERHHCRFS